MNTNFLSLLVNYRPRGRRSFDCQQAFFVLKIKVQAERELEKLDTFTKLKLDKIKLPKILTC